MQASDIPTKFQIPFANSAGVGYIRNIPQASQIGIVDGAASLTDGFPPLNFLPLGAGGVPPFGQDFNGLLKQMTQWSRWQGAGGMVRFDATLCTAMGGYPQGAIVAATNGLGFWYSLLDNNLNNPDTATNPLASGWLGFFAPVQFLTANANYYVNPATGSDSYDGTAAVVGGGHGPWATLQKAMNFITQFNLNGFNIAINCADNPNYAPLTLYPIPGSGNVNWVGNSTTPGNCKIVAVSVSAISAQYCGQSHTFNGFACQATGAYTNDPMIGLHVVGSGTKIQASNMSWGACLGGHYSAEQGASLNIAGIEIVTGGCAGSVGGNGAHANVSNGAVLQTPAAIQTTVTTAVSFAAGWFSASGVALGQILYAPLTGGGNVTGQRYQVNTNAVINTNGGGATYYPGTVAGTTSTGGQYV